MIRLGVVDFDSSHSLEFTKRLNHAGVPEDQWVEGARVVGGCPLPSAITEQARVDAAAKAFQEMGLPLVARPEELLGSIDGVLIEAVDGSVHLERARPFIDAGLPVYVDKPFACSLRDAREMADLAAKKKIPLFSSSSLRYAAEVVSIRAHPEQVGRVLGCDAYSPASLHPRNPGLFHYGIHGVETLYALMGPGCETVRCAFEEGVEVVTGRWKGGRVGTVRGIRAGSQGFGFTAFCEKRVVPAAMSTQYIYRDLLREIVGMFTTGKAPLDIAETIEIVAFIEAALRSSKESGAEIRLPS